MYVFPERGDGREEERKRNISVWLPLVYSQLGTWPATQACALTGNQTGDPLICRPALNPLSHTSHGQFNIINFTINIDNNIINIVIMLYIRYVCLPTSPTQYLLFVCFLPLINVSKVRLTRAGTAVPQSPHFLFQQPQHGALTLLVQLWTS